MRVWRVSLDLTSYIYLGTVYGFMLRKNVMRLYLVSKKDLPSKN